MRHIFIGLLYNTVPGKPNDGSPRDDISSAATYCMIVLVFAKTCFFVAAFPIPTSIAIAGCVYEYCKYSYT